MTDLEMTEPAGFDWSVFAKQHGRSLINIFLVLLVFLFIVRPLIKSVKAVRSEVGGQTLLTAEEEKTLLEAPESDLLPEPEHSSNRSRAVHQARQDVEKTATLVRTWVNEA
jgi:flagellar M-ring protein FliF